jgi:hypothetical protein
MGVLGGLLESIFLRRERIRCDKRLILAKSMNF